MKYKNRTFPNAKDLPSHFIARRAKNETRHFQEIYRCKNDPQETIQNTEYISKSEKGNFGLIMFTVQCT